MESQSLQDVLNKLDVKLSNAEKKALDEQGYLILRDAVDADSLRRIRQVFEETANREDQSLSSTGTRGVKGLADDAFLIDTICTHPKVLAAVHHILGRDFGLRQIGGRDPRPGYGQQGLHADWLPRTKGEPFHVVTSIWMLDDFTAANGATRIVPGTHVFIGPVPKQFADPASRHPREMQAIASAGSVLVMNGHLWHSGMRNNSNTSRRALQCIFGPRSQQPML